MEPDPASEPHDSARYFAELKTSRENTNSHYPAGLISIFQVNVVSIKVSLAWAQELGWQKHYS